MARNRRSNRRTESNYQSRKDDRTYVAIVSKNKLVGVWTGEENTSRFVPAPNDRDTRLGALELFSEVLDDIPTNDTLLDKQVAIYGINCLVDCFTKPGDIIRSKEVSEEAKEIKGTENNTIENPDISADSHVSDTNSEINQAFVKVFSNNDRSKQLQKFELAILRYAVKYGMGDFKYQSNKDGNDVFCKVIDFIQEVMNQENLCFTNPKYSGSKSSHLSIIRTPFEYNSKPLLYSFEYKSNGACDGINNKEVKFVVPSALYLITSSGWE